MLSEYDEHEVEVEICQEVSNSGGGSSEGGGGDGGGTAADGSSSTEPSIGLTPDDESPSLGK